LPEASDQDTKTDHFTCTSLDTTTTDKLLIRQHDNEEKVTRHEQGTHNEQVTRHEQGTHNCHGIKGAGRGAPTNH